MTEMTKEKKADGFSLALISRITREEQQSSHRR